jgi:hypothetical protein
MNPNMLSSARTHEMASLMTATSPLPLDMVKVTAEIEGLGTPSSCIDALKRRVCFRPSIGLMSPYLLCVYDSIQGK